MKQVAFPGTPPSPRQAGARRQAVGAAAERVVERAHEACVAAGLASPLLRLDAGVRVGPGGRAVIRAKGSVDYTATLKGGRSLVIEVKSFDGDRWKLTALADHQVKALVEAHALGAMTLVLLVSPTDLYVVPWQRVRDWIFKAADGEFPASVSRALTLHSFRVPRGRLYLKTAEEWDW